MLLSEAFRLYLWLSLRFFDVNFLAKDKKEIEETFSRQNRLSYGASACDDDDDDDDEKDDDENDDDDDDDLEASRETVKLPMTITKHVRLWWRKESKKQKRRR